MNARLKGLEARIGEARRLGTGVSSQFGYLAAHYLARLQSHAPLELPKFSLPVTVRANGRDMRAYVRTNNADWGILRDIFVDLEYALKQPPTHVRRIVDLGGNCGYAAMYLSTCFPEAEIVALEPMPETARACRRNFEANNLRGEVIQAACGREDGFADLLITDNDACHSLLPMHEWRQKLRVETLSFPSLLKRKAWDNVDLLKIDIEGYEQVLFEGSPAWLEKVRFIVGELHGDYGLAEVQRDLAAFGFQVDARAIGTNHTFTARRDET